MRIFKKILVAAAVSACLFILSSCSDFNLPDFARDTLNSLSEEDKELIALNSETEYASNSINLNSGYPAKVCCIEDTDTLFYSDDKNLYQLTGGKTLTLFNTEAAALNVADGNLFFIAVEDRNIDRLCGSVYRFDLKEQRLNKILDEGVSNISVYGGKIFYYITLTKEKDGLAFTDRVCYRCDYDGNNVEELEGFAFNQEKGILPVCLSGGEEKGVYLEDTVSGERSFLTDDTAFYESSLAICGGYIYALANIDEPVGGNPDVVTTTSNIKKISIEDGSVTKFQFGGSLYISDYTVCGDILYAYDNVYNSIIKVASDGTKTGYSGQRAGYSAYRALYSCGGEVYALKTNNKLYRLSFVEEDGKRSVEEELLEP